MREPVVGRRSRVVGCRAGLGLIAGLLLVWPLGAVAQTGSLGRVTSDEFVSGRIVSPELLIQGKIAGVEVIESPEPGGGVSLRIRGGSSLSGNEPLFVVDGVALAYGGGISAGRNPLAFIDPADVASITVLKDATAAAIYGSRASNGVVLIETKGAGGAAPAAGLTYHGSISGSSAVDEPDMLDADQFRDLVAAYDAANGENISATLGDADTDWSDEVQRTGIGHDHAAAIAGSRGATSYRLSFGYLSQQGVARGDALQRGTLALNLGQGLFDDRLFLAANLKGAHIDDDFTPFGALQGALAMTPTETVRDDTSSFGGFFEWPDALAPRNPVAELELTSDGGTTRRALAGVEAALRVPFIEALTATVRFGYDATTTERDASRSPELKAEADGSAPGYVSRTEGSMANTLVEAFLEYDLARAGFDVDLLAGYSRDGRDAEFDFHADDGEPPVSSIDRRLELDDDASSIIGRSTVSFRDRYTLTLGLRHETSSSDDAIAGRNAYPSAGIAWRVASEPFMARSGTISDLTLRASWGVTGNRAFATHLFSSTYDIGEATRRHQFGGMPALVPVNPDLEREEVTSYDVGVDFGLLDDRVIGSIDYYTRTTDNLMLGFSNIGTRESSGLELSLDAVLASGADDGFWWSAGFNAAHGRSELGLTDGRVFLTGAIAGGIGNFIQVLQSGEPANSFFVYQRRSDNPDFGDMDGDTDIDAADLYVDLDGDGVINEDDRRAFGSPTPDWVIGHTSRMGWRRFDLTVGLRAHLGHQVYDNVASSRGSLSMLGIGPYNLHRSVLETGFESPQYFSDYYVEDASFLRMDQLTLGYTLGADARIRVFGTVQTVFTMTEYRGGDPQGGVNGIDNRAHPRARTVVVGANLNF